MKYYFYIHFLYLSYVPSKLSRISFHLIYARSRSDEQGKLPLAYAMDGYYDIRVIYLVLDRTGDQNGSTRRTRGRDLIVSYEKRA